MMGPLLKQAYDWASRVYPYRRSYTVYLRPDVWRQLAGEVLDYSWRFQPEPLQAVKVRNVIFVRRDDL